jgi:hypothetical protein
MLLNGLLVELAGERDDLAVVQLASARPASGVVLPHPLELDVLFGAAQPRFIRIFDAERELDLATAHQGDEPLRHALPEPEKFASRILPRLYHAKTHRGATFVYHRSFSESLVLPLDTEFSTLFGSYGGEGGTLRRFCSIRPSFREKLRLRRVTGYFVDYITDYFAARSTGTEDGNDCRRAQYADRLGSSRG